MRGSHTHGRGFKKRARGSGNQGGVGMAGTGKRADQKKTYVLNLYGNDYFGKDKRLARKPKIKLEEINLQEINDNFDSMLKKGIIKETKKGEYEMSMKGYKILGNGEIDKKIKINASATSQSASEKVKKKGGEIFVGN